MKYREPAYTVRKGMNQLEDQTKARLQGITRPVGNTVSGPNRPIQKPSPNTRTVPKVVLKTGVAKMNGIRGDAAGIFRIGRI